MGDTPGGTPPPRKKRTDEPTDTPTLRPLTDAPTLKWMGLAAPKFDTPTPTPTPPRAVSDTPTLAPPGDGAISDTPTPTPPRAISDTPTLAPPGAIPNIPTLAPPAHAHDTLDRAKHRGPLDTPTLPPPAPGSAASLFAPMPDGATLVNDDIDRIARADSGAEGRQVPGYQMLERLGAGTFGEVWSAVQKSTGQKVALKILLHRSSSDLRYMQREVSRLSSVAEHPNVLTVIDANLEYSPPYLVTPLLNGGSLEALIHKVPPERVAAVMEQLATALAFVHGKGVIHCDLKPANILLDNEGAVRIVDWGQAQVGGHKGVSLGTLWYMSPEQAAVPSDGVEVVPDVSWDVYALGATMYHLLSGTLPRSTDQGQRSLGDLVDTARYLERYRAQLANTPLTPLRSIDPKIDPDLAAIVEHCLSLDPVARYLNMGDVVADLRRRREKFPLLARPRTLRYVAGTFLARNRWRVAVAALVATLLIGVAGVSLMHVVEARNQAFAARNQAVSTLATLEHQTGLAMALDGRPYAFLWLVRAAVRGASHEFASTAAWEVDSTAPVENLMTHGPAHADRESYGASSLSYNADGTLLVSAGINEEVKLWDAHNGRPVAPPLQHKRYAGDALFSPDGRRLVTRSLDRMLRLWGLDGKPLTPPVMAKSIMQKMAWSPDGALLAIPSASGVLLLDGRTAHATVSALRSEARCNAVAWSPHGRRLALGTESGEAQIWDLHGIAPSMRLKHTDWVSHVAFSPDGRQLATACFGGTVRLWSVADGRLLDTFAFSTTTFIRAFEFAPDGRFLAASADGMVKIHKDRTTITFAQVDSLTMARFNQDGTLIATASRDGGARLWDAQSGQMIAPPLLHAGPVQAAAFSPDGDGIATLGADGQVRLWSLRNLRETHAAVLDFPFGTTAPRLVARPGEMDIPSPMALSPHAERVALNMGRTVTVRDIYNGRETTPALAHPAAVSALAFAPDGAVLYTVADDQVLRAWRLSDGTLLRSTKLPGRLTVFDAAGDRLVVAGADGRVHMWSTAEARATATFAGLPAADDSDKAGVLTDLNLVAIDPGGKRVAFLGARGHLLKVCDAATGKTVFLSEDQPNVRRMHFSPNGDRLVLFNDAPCFSVVDLDKGTQTPFDGQDTGDGCFSPDGRLVVTAGRNGAVRVFDAATLEPQGEDRMHDDRVTNATFSPDSRYVLSTSLDHTVRVWETGDASAAAPAMHGMGMGSLYRVIAGPDRFVVVGDRGYRVLPLLHPKAIDVDSASKKRTGLTLDDNGHPRALSTEEFGATREAAPSSH